MLSWLKISGVIAACAIAYAFGFSDGQDNVREHTRIDVGYGESLREPFIACVLASGNPNDLTVCAREHAEPRARPTRLAAEHN